MELRSMGEIYSITHKTVEDIFFDEVEITEKVDGSFISFTEDKETGELLMRSKGQQLFSGSPSSKMFEAGISAIKERADLLVPGHIWRGEYLRTPKHNSLAYSRIPQGHIVIFDIEIREGQHMSAETRKVSADFLGFESVPVLFDGVWDKGVPALKELLEIESFLGGQKIEGVVVKNFSRFDHGKPLMGKLVSEAFKEVHAKEWKVSNPNQKDVVETLIESYAVEARWLKSIQHLRDDGQLTNSPQDIGPLLKAIAEDIKKEEEEAIKEALWKWAWPKISRGSTRGFPEFYKNKLMEGKDEIG